MANNDNSPSVDLMRKSMKGKDDERRNNGRSPRKVKPGPKPLYLQRKTRNYSSRVLELYDSIASDEQIYTAAWKDGNYELCAQLRREHRDRAYSKAYVAENPAKAEAKQQDPRMAEAIAKLLPKARNETAKTPVM
jgi:hypothetical protein